MTRRLTFEDRLLKRHVDDRVERSCGSKRRFASRKEALAMVKNTSSATPLSFYKCSVCRGFHLTRRQNAPGSTAVQHAS